MSEQTEKDSPDTGSEFHTKKVLAANFRIQALYHNCLSSASFKREDAERETDENEQIALRREAMAFEQCAQWLRHANIDPSQ